MKQKITYVAFVLALVVAFTAVANYNNRPTPAAAVANTSHPTPSPCPTVTPIGTGAPTATPTNTPDPGTPTATPTDTPTATPSPTPTDTPTATPSPTPTDTPTPSPSPTPTDTPTAGPTNTPGAGGFGGTQAQTTQAATSTRGDGSDCHTEAPRQLKVSTNGNGRGSVTSWPAGINCGSDCSAWYGSKTKVTLTANPWNGSKFTGWSGACSGSKATCTVIMSQTRFVTATFKLSTYSLTVTKKGAGRGTVTSSPSGIACGSKCAVIYVWGTSVTLTATPANGSTFAGWTGACSGSKKTCTVSMTQARTVTAKFN